MKQEFLLRSKEIFETHSPGEEFDRERERLYSKIGLLEIECDWLKKIPKGPVYERVEGLCILSICRQCELLSLNRSGLYYHGGKESKENLRIMDEMDK